MEEKIRVEVNWLRRDDMEKGGIHELWREKENEYMENNRGGFGGNRGLHPAICSLVRVFGF